MTKSINPKNESVRISTYPTDLVKELEEEEIECYFPGCEFKCSTVQDCIVHIKGNHPVKEVECLKCKVMTRLENKKYCEECVHTISKEEDTLLRKGLAENCPEENVKTNDNEIVRQRLNDRKCIVCGSQLQSNDMRRKLCDNVECRRKQQAKYNSAWKEKNPTGDLKKPRSYTYSDIMNSKKQETPGATELLYEKEPEIIHYSLIDGRRLKLIKVGDYVTEVTILPRGVN